jgi:hypothetical protein
MDKWVDVSRIDVNQKVAEPPQNKEVPIAIVEQAEGDRKITRNQKRKHDEINHVQKVPHQFCT